MANSKSATKRARQNKSQAERNKTIRTSVKSVDRLCREAIASGDFTSANTALQNATQTIRRACSKGIMHKVNASRRVSRLVIAVNKLK